MVRVASAVRAARLARWVLPAFGVPVVSVVRRVHPARQARAVLVAPLVPMVQVRYFLPRLG